MLTATVLYSPNSGGKHQNGSNPICEWLLSRSESTVECRVSCLSEIRIHLGSFVL